MKLRKYHSSHPRSLKLTGSALGLLFIALLAVAPREARAKSGETFLETIGIGIAVGTVLGASTLPFYDQPGDHLANMAYGAAAGTVAALGIEIYGWLSGSSGDEQALEGKLSRYAGRFSNSPNSAMTMTTTALSARPPAFWTPLVSLNW